MSQFTTEAIVISTWEYGEGDLVTSLFTMDLGKLRGMAKRALRMRSRFGAALQPMNIVRLHSFMREGQELCSLRSCDIIKSYHHLSGDLGRLRMGYAVIKNMDLMTAEWEENRDLYRLSLDALRVVDEFHDPASCLRGYRAKLLSLTGYEPQLNGCVACGGAVTGREMGFSPSLGGVTCGRCAKGIKDALRISPGSLSFLKKLIALDLEKGQRLRASERMEREIDAVLDHYYTHILGREVRTPSIAPYI